MWSLPADRNRTSAPALALGFHCSVFKKRLSDDRTRRCVERTRVITPLAYSPVVTPAPWDRALESGQQTLVSTGPVVPGPQRYSEGAAGVRGEERD